MKTKEIKSEKRIYSNPEIIIIELDNEISLALESNPPLGPDEVVQSTQINPFKDNGCLV